MTNPFRRCSTSRTKQMAKQVKLKAEPRTNVGRSAVRKLKARGVIPAIIYGGKDKPLPLQVAGRDINAMMSHASGENILVELEIAGEKSSRTALVQDDLTAFSVLAPTVEEEPAAAEAEAAAAGPEVIGEKKEEGEAAASATPAAKEKAPKEKEQKK